MKAFVAVVASLVAAASGAPAPQTTIQKIGYGPSTIERAPAFDSASIESHRFGGNFAYATAEAHAYKAQTAEISRATFPVAEHTHVAEQPVIATVKKAPVVKTTYAASPVYEQRPVLAQEPVIGPVAQHTTYHQPLAKVQTVQHTIAQPAVAVAAAPAQVAYAAQPAQVAYAAQPALAAGPLTYAQPALAAGLPALAAAPANLAYAAAPAAIVQA